MAEYIEREDTINSKPEGRNPQQFGKEEYNKGWNDCRRYFVQIIESQTAADVAPVVHGRWIRFKEHDSCYVHMRCSECSAYWSDPSHADSFRYCPNCGAKMDGGGDSD